MIDTPIKYHSINIPYIDSITHIFDYLLPEFLIFLSIIFYFLLFLTNLGRSLKFNFSIYFICLFLFLLALYFTPSNYNFQFLLISFYYVWYIKFFLVICVLGFTILHFYQIYFAWYLNNKIELDLGSKYFELNLFLLVALFASFLLISSGDFMIFYVNIEILNICFTLICYLIYERTTIEATLKYFFVNIIFSYFILLGICFIYFGFYSFNFYHIIHILSDFIFYLKIFLVEHNLNSSDNFLNSIREYGYNFITYYLQKQVYYENNNLEFSAYIIHNRYVAILNMYLTRKLKWLLLGLFFIFIGLLGKIGLFPGFFWVLDVYGNISVLSNAILSIFPKVVYITLLCHLGFCFEIFVCQYNYKSYLFLFFLAGIITLFYAVIFTLNQWRIKRFMAGSSLVNLSFLIFLIGIFIYDIDYNLIPIIFLFISIYLLNLFFFFFIYILFIQPSNVKINYYFEDLRDFVQIRINHKLLTFCLALIILSLIGVPPLVGFYSKLALFYYLVLNQSILIIFIIIIANVISCFYYLRAIRFILFSSSKIFGLFSIQYNFYFYSFICVLLIFLFSFLFFSDFIILVLLP